MATLQIGLGDRDYTIDIRPDFSALAEAKLPYSEALIVTDSNVGPLYLEQVSGILRDKGIAVASHVIPAGEASKTLQTVSAIYRSCLNGHLTRKSVVVALGGGVVGDMAGFVAASYMRGTGFLQIPTSLLAQIDSSVGGKVGVDFGGYKNLVGAFYQPDAVLINTSLLRTLPVRELRAGFGEAVKYGVIYDRTFFDFLSEQLDAIMRLEEQPVQQMIYRCCEIKADVVRQDERESGLRMILNFGHTIGHAIESVSGFSLLHGECVSLGMVAAENLARALGMFPEGSGALTDVLKRAGLPTSVSGLSRDAVIRAMQADKKNVSGRTRFVLPSETGRVEIVENVPASAVGEAVDSVLF